MGVVPSPDRKTRQLGCDGFGEGAFAARGESVDGYDDLFMFYCLEFWVLVIGFLFWGLRYRVHNLGFRVWALGCGALGLEFRLWGTMFMVSV